MTQKIPSKWSSPISSLFQKKKNRLKNYEYNADLNRDLDKFCVKLIKIVGAVGIIWGLFILIAFG
jgi:hypothetical protein